MSEKQNVLRKGMSKKRAEFNRIRHLVFGTQHSKRSEIQTEKNTERLKVLMRELNPGITIV